MLCRTYDCPYVAFGFLLVIGVSIFYVVVSTSTSGVHLALVESDGSPSVRVSWSTRDAARPAIRYGDQV
jgi:hypothetical protein